MLSVFNKAKKSVTTSSTPGSTSSYQATPPRLDRLPSTAHGHPDGGAMSRVVMVCKTEQSTVTSNHGAEETVTRVTVSTFRGNRAERRVTTTEKSTPGTPRTPAIPAATSAALTTTTNTVSKPGDFATECLKAHNEYRATHKVPPLVLNRKLCRHSEDWARHLAERGAMEHRNDMDLGENIYCCWSGKSNRGAELTVTGREPVDSWYREGLDHPYGQEPTTLRTGHFTQVVWRDSRELGVGIARSKQGHVFVVANYSPAGNFVGNFAENVPPPGGFLTNTECMQSKDAGGHSSGHSSTSSSERSQLEEVGLKVHNDYRAIHGSAPLVISRKLCDYAKEWAKKLARDNLFQHRPDGEYGENIYSAWRTGKPFSVEEATRAAIKSWYDEEPMFKYGHEPKDLRAGHFTQLVWEDSRELGMGYGRGDKNRIVIVANYSPRGNIIGRFAKKVPRPLKQSGKKETKK